MQTAALTPLSSLILGELARESGAPAGVLTVITSSDAAAVTTALLADPRLRKLSKGDRQPRSPERIPDRNGGVKQFLPSAPASQSLVTDGKGHPAAAGRAFGASGSHGSPVGSGSSSPGPHQAPQEHMAPAIRVPWELPSPPT